MRAGWLMIILSLFSCNKALDPGLPTNVTVSQTVYATDANAAAVLTGLYYKMSNGGPASGATSCAYYCGLSADEFTLQVDDELLNSLYSNSLTPANVPLWSQWYNYIYQVNAAVEGLGDSKTLTPAVKQQLTGEAKFIRAFCYFYLVNLFGDVPLVITTNYKANATISRSDTGKVYTQIVADLEEAQTLLSDHYLEADVLTSTTERVRPTKWAAIALLARVYLYRRNWEAAIAQASEVIAQQSLYDTVSLSNVFLKNTKEAIWQLQPVNGSYTEDGLVFNTSQTITISPFLLAAFEKTDRRKDYWIKNDIPYKYRSYEADKTTTEYLMVLRLTEQYLTRAEAKAHLSDFTGARADLNLVRYRAGLDSTTSTSLLSAIQQERRVEFFSEWGHRWLDLKRNNDINNIMSVVTPQKNGVWDSYKQLYPIPENDRKLNAYLTQNAGY
jgi:starch-binding outer membrane protein, SusD/RagB family